MFHVKHSPRAACQNLPPRKSFPTATIAIALSSNPSFATLHPHALQTNVSRETFAYTRAATSLEALASPTPDAVPHARGAPCPGRSRPAPLAVPRAPPAPAFRAHARVPRGAATSHGPRLALLAAPPPPAARASHSSRGIIAPHDRRHTPCPLTSPHAPVAPRTLPPSRLAPFAAASALAGTFWPYQKLAI